MARPTRTFNPLPFQDLDPHRFEDLVRQLAYDFRRWISLEATGRGGSDDGVDIRGVELVSVDPEPGEEGADPPGHEGRLWIFQCKREKTLTPKRVHEAVTESLRSLSRPPHGFVLAAACDISKKARDAFRTQMVELGIEEFAIWAKGELEDMLFQPRNDRLLFAYFGISLQPRRQSTAALVRSQIAKRKQLSSLLGDESDDGKLVLLRDPTDDRYPGKPKKGESRRGWLACYAMSVRKPGCLVVLRRSYLAALTAEGKSWDAVFEYDETASRADAQLRTEHAWARGEGKPRIETPHAFWNEYIPERQRAFLRVFRCVPLDRILAIDLLGDGYFPVPHIFVEFEGASGPFNDERIARLERVRRPGFHDGNVIVPSDSNRTTIFPKPLPAELDPPPAEFDNTVDASTPLSVQSQIALDTLLAIPKKNPTGTASDAPPGEPGQRDQHAFREWRDGVAKPVLSTFVLQLRNTGHGARVVTGIEDGQEFVELRVRMDVGFAYNPSYRASGHLRISASRYAKGWRIDASPSARKGEGSETTHGSSLEPVVSGISKEDLESRVLAVLERLRASRW